MTRRAKPGPEHVAGLRWAARVARSSARKWRRSNAYSIEGDRARQAWIDEATDLADAFLRLAREAERGDA